MPDIEIPRGLVAGLRSLIELTDVQVEELERVLNRIQPSLGRKKILASVRAGLSTPPPNIERLIDALMQVESYRTYTELPIDEFLENLFSSPESLRELKLEAPQLQILRERLSRLLVSPSISVASKASGVLNSHERAFLASRVFTDIRAVFRDERGSGPPSPAAAVLIHMLRINYIHAGEVDEFFVALDDTDVKKLIKTLNRAVAKADSLKKLIPQGIQYLETNSD